MKKFLILIFSIFYINLGWTQLQYNRLNIQNSLFGNVNIFGASNLQNMDLKNDSKIRKSVPLAVALSLVIPGMGELYVGNYKMGRYLTGSEAALWITYVSMNFYGQWVRDDARLFASEKAGIDLRGKSGKYFVDIGNYSDIYQYNERKLQERKEDQIYDPFSYYWKWENDSDRMRYKNLRIKSDEIINSSQFIIAAIIANHIISAVNAGRLAIKFNKDGSEAILLNPSIKGTVFNPIYSLTISKQF